MKPIDHERQEIVCPDCDSHDVPLSYEKQTFEYGVGAEAVLLSADVPMYRCGECGYAFVGPQGADIEHEIICRHLGLLSPSEIKGIRVKLGFSQAALAGLTGIGVASIARWEAGHLMQNRSYDNLLRMLVYPENVERLQTRFASGQVPLPARVTKIVPRALPKEQLGRLQSSQVRFSLRTG
jgi:putative zinc finger/helix-turn-helix YgiT family protein